MMLMANEPLVDALLQPQREPADGVDRPTNAQQAEGKAHVLSRDDGEVLDHEEFRMRISIAVEKVPRLAVGLKSA